jgi:amidohydrolase
MQIDPAINGMHDEVTAWRRYLHAHPELGYDLDGTAAFVADKLKTFGCDEIATKIGKSGVVGVIKGKKQSSNKVICLRADMDALPMEELTGLSYASQTAGRMHACGHDGHMAMLLGAARHLTKTRNFDGTAVVIFQPAEEGGGGAKAMIDDGLMSRWNIQQVFGMHNDPGLGIGCFSTCSGTIGAAVDVFRILVEGKGAHGAEPHLGVDPLLAAANILMSLQSIVARNLDPLKKWRRDRRNVSWGEGRERNPADRGTERHSALLRG